MASIEFRANILGNLQSTLIPHTAGSGIGFYGAGFGVSVPIGSQQSKTYITNSAGTSAGAELNNTSMATVGTNVTAGTASLNGGSAIPTSGIPNYQAPLNIRFTHTESVAVQNCKLRIFDRNNIDNPASGVSTYVYEVRHPSIVQTIRGLSHRGRSSHDWLAYEPSDNEVVDMAFTNSPGVSGLNTSSSDTNVALGYTTQQGASHRSLQHDWYVALSSEPETIGSKTNYALYFSLEYL
jgi:hypothetical protein